MCHKCESASRRFQPGEGPSWGLLRDYEPSDANRMQLFEALILTVVPPDPAGPGDGLHLDGLVELLCHGVAHSRAETGDH